MKLAGKLLISMLSLLFIGLFFSNFIQKRELENMDKTDLYWNFRKILDQPFRHININGGNVINIVYERSSTHSVKVLKYWEEFDKIFSMPFIKNDTLFINLHPGIDEHFQKEYLRRSTLIRIFSPDLISVTCKNSNLEMYKLDSKNISINASGKSSLKIECSITNLDSLRTLQTDSSVLEFKIDPMIKNDAAVHTSSFSGDLRGASMLNISRAYIDSMDLNLTDSASIFLSGSALKKIR